MDLLVFKLQMEIFNWGVASSIEVKVYNGQGLGGYPIPMGSEWLTNTFTSSITLTLVTYCYNLMFGKKIKSS